MTEPVKPLLDEAPASVSADSPSAEPRPEVDPSGIGIVVKAFRHPGRVRLWNRDFVLLWQGQLVSELGNVAFNIALGFWVLAATGSTAKMGLVLAVFALPWLFVSPFAGVLTDRSNRKGILILTDLIRGVALVAMAVLILTDIFPFWAIIPIGLVVGTCGAFFNPAINSAVPDIVPPRQLVRANSLRSLTTNFVSMLGTAIGGTLYSLIGAPILFLVDGASFLVSSLATVFIRIPKVERSRHKMELTYFEDLKDGFRFMRRFGGIRFILFEAVALNFFMTIGSILLTPFFMQMNASGEANKDWILLQQSELGQQLLRDLSGSAAMLYGFAVGAYVLGNFLGAGVTAIAQIRPRQRALVVAVTGLIGCFCMIAVGQMRSFFPVLGLMALAGVCVAIALTILNTVLQTGVPQDMRGKMFGLMAAFIGASTPLAMGVGGVVGDPHVLGPGLAISLAFVIAFFVSLPLAFAKDVHAMVNFDPTTQHLEDILRERPVRAPRTPEA